MTEVLITVLGSIFYGVCIFLTVSLYCEKNIDPSFWSLLFFLVPPFNVFTAFFGLKLLIHKKSKRNDYFMGFKEVFISPFTSFIKQVVVEEKPKYRV